MDSPCVSLDKLFVLLILILTLIIMIISLSGAVTSHSRSPSVQDHLCHDHLCEADGAAVVGVKGNSQLVIVPQGVRCALGLIHPGDNDDYDDVDRIFGNCDFDVLVRFVKIWVMLIIMAMTMTILIIGLHATFGLSL